jgi:hypothetical protein
MNEIEAYIRQGAIARGEDPDYAVSVAKAEGGLANPFQHGLGKAPKSQDPSFGSTENSFGPFQLYISGHDKGLGDAALAAGIDPRKDWKKGVDFALDTAKTSGWGQWYGARKIGLPSGDPAENAMNLQASTRHRAPTQAEQAQTVQAQTPPPAAVDATQPDPNAKKQLMQMTLAASMANVRLQPVDYDPFAVMPHFGA